MIRVHTGDFVFIFHFKKNMYTSAAKGISIEILNLVVFIVIFTSRELFFIFS